MRNMADMVKVEHLKKNFGDLEVLKDINLTVAEGEKLVIIGPSGSGKSTLLKIIAGLDKSYQGEVVFSPGYSVGYLAQEPYLDDTKTVKEVVMEGVQPIVDALAEYEDREGGRDGRCSTYSRYFSGV